MDSIHLSSSVLRLKKVIKTKILRRLRLIYQTVLVQHIWSICWSVYCWSNLRLAMERPEIAIYALYILVRADDGWRRTRNGIWQYLGIV